MNLSYTISRYLPLFASLTTVMTLPLALAQSPVYHQSFTDDVWSPVGGGAFRASVASENYANEVWERSVEDGKWVESGGYRTTTGKYYAYGDLSAAAMGYDNQYLYLSFSTVGSFIQNVGESPVSAPLKAQYYMYFGVGNDPDKRYLVNLGDGSGVKVGGFTQVGKLYHDANQDLFGSGLHNTYDGLHPAGPRSPLPAKGPGFAGNSRIDR